MNAIIATAAAVARGCVICHGKPAPLHLGVLRDKHAKPDRHREDALDAFVFFDVCVDCLEVVDPADDSSPEKIAMTWAKGSRLRKLSR